MGSPGKSIARAHPRRYEKYIGMEFEYDPEKSKANRAKHGIDFEDAQELWADDDRLVIPARSETESRWAMLARHGARVWAAFYTLRDGRVRLISVRRARPNEKATYEGGRFG